MRSRNHLLAVALCTLVSLVPRVSGAQATRTGVEHRGDAQLRAISDSLATQHVISRLLGDRGGYTYAIARRDTSGTAEVHERWTDVFVVRSGRGTILLGGRLADERVQSGGERRGSGVEGATRQALAAGDLLVIPAGTPHQVLLAPGEQLVYLALKIAAPADSARSR